MTSETLCVSSQNGGGFCGESKTHNNIDYLECQSTLPCSYEEAEKSCPQEINKILCYSGERIDQNLREPNEVACCDGNVPSTGVADVMRSQNVSQQRGNTLQDLYMQGNYDDEDDDDSDWEPSTHFIIRKWFCRNCTMPNFDDVDHCDVCGVHKEYEISGYDSLRSFIGQGAQASIDFNAIHKGSLSENCTAIGFDERMLLHSEVELKPHPHPERPDRLRAIVASLAAAGIFPGKCQLIPAREITLEELQLVHSLDHIVAVQQTSQLLSSYFTSDTYANRHSAFAARIAAGLCADLAHSIMSGRTKNGFALVRPPGHHAGVKHAMGFCLHNNAAVAALAAQRAGAKKVLVVDWDVHHGNGTQEIFDGNKSVLYVSLHRHEGGRFYPGTGAAAEVGIMDGKGYSVNIPWSCGGVGDNDYIFAFQNVVLPIASEFDPDITIISAGFDAARGDPLGCCDVTPAGYAQMTYLLSALSKGKLLVILEGGYNLHSISSSATAVVKVLLGENPECEMSNSNPSKAGLLTVLQVLNVQMEFWPILEPNYIALQSQWELISSSRRKEAKKRLIAGPVWWRWGSKRFVYELIYGGFPLIKHSKRLCTHRRQ